MNKNSKQTNNLNLLNLYFSSLKSETRLSDSDKSFFIQEYFEKSRNPGLGKVLISDHLRLVLSRITKRFKVKPGSQFFLDLVQEGNLGLVDGLRKFDLEKSKESGKTLSSYLTYWVDAYIFNFLVKNHRLIRVKSGQDRKLYFKLAKAKAKLTKELGDERLVTFQLLAQELKVDAEKISEMNARLSPDAELSLNKQVFSQHSSSNSDAELQDLLPDDQELSDSRIENIELRTVLTEELLKLREENFTNFTRSKKRAIIDYCLLAQIDPSLEVKTHQELANMWSTPEKEFPVERVRGLEKQLKDVLGVRLIARLGHKEELAFLWQKKST